MYNELGISEKIENLSNEVEEEIKEEFKKIENISTYNSLKVLKALKIIIYLKCTLILQQDMGMEI